jgi:DNA polymerase-1
MHTTLLVDGDEYLFKACSACEREIHWDDVNHVLYCNRNEAWGNFTRMLSELQEKLSANCSILCFSGARPYFREELYPDYKRGRSSRKPLCYAELRKLCDEEYLTTSFDGLEADDVLGILATKPGHDTVSRKVIVSQDKDMLTIPGFLWREGALAESSPRQAMQWHYYQTLCGDKSDGYPGCPGLGEKRALEWLEAEDEEGEPWSWERVVAAYKKKKLTEQDALLQARMARILQWSDWDYERKEPILWVPNAVR